MPTTETWSDLDTFIALQVKRSPKFCSHWETSFGEFPLEIGRDFSYRWLRCVKFAIQDEEMLAVHRWQKYRQTVF